MTEPLLTKRCTKCGETKPASAFNHPSWCKTCKRVATQEYRQKQDPEKRREYAREYKRIWREKNPAADLRAKERQTAKTSAALEVCRGMGVDLDAMADAKIAQKNRPAS